MKKFKSYDQVAAYMAKARNPAKGRPLPVTGCRLMPGDAPGSYKFERYGKHVLTIRPDNMLEFQALPLDFALGYSLFMVFGDMDLIRRTGGRPAKIKTSAGSYEAHPGLEIDMTTHQSPNAKLPFQDRAYPEMRRQWLRDRKRWADGFLVRLRLGTYTNTATPIIYSGDFIKDWVAAIKSHEFPVTLCATIAMRMPSGVTPDESLRQMLNDYSYELREAYGVFHD